MGDNALSRRGSSLEFVNFSRKIIINSDLQCYKDAFLIFLNVLNSFDSLTGRVLRIFEK